jgi:hypothetical protein
MSSEQEIFKKTPNPELITPNQSCEDQVFTLRTLSSQQPFLKYLLQ